MDANASVGDCDMCDELLAFLDKSEGESGHGGLWGMQGTLDSLDVSPGPSRYS